MLPHESSSEDSEAEVEYRSPCVVSEKSEGEIVCSTSRHPTALAATHGLAEDEADSP